ncbi:hypothetical protein QOZ80_1BG0094530 [Eleusine coracana subsp. coracana]|nr:hypothetical protein QOZ80_1BG0094530 [Eleusine coracana subsp. coracana]
MNPNDAARRIPKRRRTSKSIVPLLDLNSPPAEAAGVGVPSSSMAVLRNQASSSVPPVANGPQIGLQSTPIDVETIDDDVMIYESRPFTQTRQRSTRAETVTITVIIDDDSETNLEPSGDGLDEHVNTLLSLGINRRNVLPTVSSNSPVISLLDSPEVSIINPPVIKAPPAPVEVVPREPKFTCPVCLNELTEPSSTSCGHIFCQKCIKASIQAQKKCPTCRQKLTNKGFHRVYLPTME